jgi:hypothetical protein
VKSPVKTCRLRDSLDSLHTSPHECNMNYMVLPAGYVRLITASENAG